MAKQAHPKNSKTKKIIRDVVAYDARFEAAKRCDVALENGRIVELTPVGSAAGDVCFDGKGSTAVLPGFVNAHGHAAMTLLRGLGEEMALMDWLKERIWPVENNLNGRMVAAGTKQAILEMLATGTTCFADMYFFMDEVARATLEMGMRAGLSRGLVGDDEYKLEENLQLAAAFDGAEDGLLRVQLGPHAPYTVTREGFKRVARIAVEKKLGVQAHWLETQWELSYFKDELKADPVDFLEETGVFDVPYLTLAHGVWFGQEHLARIARDNVFVVHNPRSNLKLGSGYAPIKAMLDAGVNVALGTDGAASNNRLDMWDEIRTCALMHKGFHHDPTLVTSRQALRMATETGARALGFPDAGLLEPGYRADLALVDLDGPHYVGWDLENLPGYIVYAGSSADVCATFVAGELLYDRDGMKKFPKFDAEAIVREARAAREELLAK